MRPGRAYSSPVRPSPTVWSFCLVALWAYSASGAAAFAAEEKGPDRHCATITPLEEGEQVTALAEDRFGFLWLETPGGPIRFDGRRFSPGRLEPADAEPEPLLRADARGDLWWGEADPLRLDPVEGSFRAVPESPRWSSEPRTESSGRATGASAVYTDRGGHEWSAHGAELCRTSKRPTSTFRPWPAETPRLVTALAAGGESRLWIGTEQGSILQQGLDDGPFLDVTAESSDPGVGAVRALWEGRDGRLWVGGDRGLLRFDPPFPSAPIRFDTAPVVALAGDALGRVWAGGEEGLIRVEATGALSRSPTLDPLPHVRCLFVDSRGILWIGTAGRGLVALSASSTVEAFPRPASDAVLSITEDRAGDLWVASLAGLQRLDLSTRTFDPPAPFPVDPFRDPVQLWRLPENPAAEDGPGGLGWMAGRTLFSMETASMATSSTATSSARTRIHRPDLPRPHRAATLLDRRLVTADEEGLRFFTLDALGPGRAVVPPILTGLWTRGRPVFPGSETLAWPGDGTAPAVVEIPSGSSLELEIGLPGAPAFDSGSLRYAYRLGGPDQPWIDIDPTAPRFHLRRLAAGKEEVWIRGRLAPGPWSEHPLPLEVKVAGSWGLESLGWGVGVLLILGVAGYLDVQRRRLVDQQASNQALLELDLERDGFMAAASYELRSPLVAITTLAESLLESLPPSSSSRIDVARIAATGRQVSRQVDEILDFSRLMHGKLELRKQRLDVRSMIDVVLTRLGVLAPEGVRLVHSVPARLPLVEADEQKIQQVLQTLVIQSLETTSEGFIEVSAQLLDDRLQIKVSDTGVGYEPAELETLFRPFAGPSLGLLVTKGLIQLHGGDLSVESIAHGGTTFSFWLPVDRGEHPDLEARPRISKPVKLESMSSNTIDLPRLGGLKGGRILLADDDETVRSLLKRYLEDRGHQVESFKSGEELLEYLDHSEQEVDVILLDVVMPGLSGFETCSRLRQDHSRQTLPVIFMSGGHGDDAVVAMSAGGNDVIEKPIIRAELLARVQLHLEWVIAYRNLRKAVRDKGHQVKALQVLLPVCSVCNRIRDASGDWETVDRFVENAARKGLDRPVCPDCLDSTAARALTRRTGLENDPAPGDDDVS